MSASFKLLTIFVVFLCLYCHETDASKEWIKDKFQDAKQAITKRFNRETLEKFLNEGPKLWAQKAISQAQKLFFKKTLGTKTPSKEELESLVAASGNNDEDEDETIHNHAAVNLPANFDSRTAWPNCPGIKDIASQTQCGSCWAVSATSAFSDRLCIATNGTRKWRISAMDLLSCCGPCKVGGDPNADGCQGGIVAYAYQHFQLKGIVTGGPYGDKFSCIPYKWAPDAHSGFGAEFVSPRCEAKCTSPMDYNKNKHYGTNLKCISKGNIVEMQRELFTKGPIVVQFMVTESFMGYNGGIYYKAKGNDPEYGGHAVRLIGWGEDKGVPYWLAANSWGPNWGEGGTFRIIRGRNECGIEEFPVAGDYDLKRSANS